MFVMREEVVGHIVGSSSAVLRSTTTVSVSSPGTDYKLALHLLLLLVTSEEHEEK
jgi:hypothetical protein